MPNRTVAWIEGDDLAHPGLQRMSNNAGLMCVLGTWPSHCSIGADLLIGFSGCGLSRILEAWLSFDSAGEISEGNRRLLGEVCYGIRRG